MVNVDPYIPYDWILWDIFHGPSLSTGGDDEGGRGDDVPGQPLLATCGTPGGYRVRLGGSIAMWRNPICWDGWMGKGKSYNE